MIREDREPPVSSEDEIDRTGRDAQVAPALSPDAPAATRERPAGLADDDAPPGGVDSADFPAVGAP